MMRLPDPFKSTPAPRYRNRMNDDDHRAWHRRDGKVRAHNLARHVAAKPTTEDRAAFLKGMERFHAPVFLVYFKRLLAWYFRRQRQTRMASEAMLARSMRERRVVQK